MTDLLFFVLAMLVFAIIRGAIWLCAINHVVESLRDIGDDPGIDKNA